MDAILQENQHIGLEDLAVWTVFTSSWTADFPIQVSL